MNVSFAFFTFACTVVMLGRYAFYFPVVFSSILRSVAVGAWFTSVSGTYCADVFGCTSTTKMRLKSLSLKNNVVKVLSRIRAMRVRASKSPPTSPSQSSTLYTDRWWCTISGLISNHTENYTSLYSEIVGNAAFLVFFISKNFFDVGGQSPQVSSSTSKKFCSSWKKCLS